MSKVFNMVGGGGGGGIKLSSIAITEAPTKTSYRPGETFSPAGMVVTATYSNGATAIATGYTFSPSTPLTLDDTEVTIQYTEMGVTRTAQQAVTVQNEVIQVPTQSGTLTYTGAVLTPQWNNCNSAVMTISGETSATNAGDYTAQFTPEYGYCWPDSTTTTKNVTWSIGKATGSVTLDKTSVTLNTSAKSVVVSVTRSGDGAISATSSDTTVASASVSGTNVTITSVGNKTGTATATISVAASTNYTAASATVQVTAQFVGIYGASWDGTATTAWTRTDAAAGFTDPVPYVAGATNYGSPFDNIKPWADMARYVHSDNKVVKIPKFWYQLTQNGAGMSIRIADGPIEGFHVSPAHMDRGDGKGERDVVYIGRHHCDSNYRSTSGNIPKTGTTRAAFRTGIHNLGANFWQVDFAMMFTIWLLYIVEFADWNSQAKIGYGCGNGSGVENAGSTDSMPYHTGTIKSSRTEYGVGVQYRNIEDPWGNVLDFYDGCYNDSNGLNIILNPNNFSDSTGGVAVGVPSSGWPSAFSVKTSGGFPMFIPTASGGSESTYSCDSWNFSASSPVVYGGGSYYQGGNRGLFFVGYTSVSNAVASLGSRLQELP